MNDDRLTVQDPRAQYPGPPFLWQPQSPSGHAHRMVPRPGQPVEIAMVYVFSASQEASDVTGEVYGVTGGIGIA